MDSVRTKRTNLLSASTMNLRHNVFTIASMLAHRKDRSSHPPQGEYHNGSKTLDQSHRELMCGADAVQALAALSHCRTLRGDQQHRADAGFAQLLFRVVDGVRHSLS